MYFQRGHGLALSKDFAVSLPLFPTGLFLSESHILSKMSVTVRTSILADDGC
jgi:hypothetical protein